MSLLRRLHSRLRTRRQEHATPSQTSALQAEWDATGPLQAALDFYHAGDLGSARNAFANVLKREAGNRHARFYLGITAGRLGDYQLARSLLAALVESDPHFVDGLNALANIEALQEHWSSAHDLYRRALALDPRSAILWCNLGSCLRAAGDFQEAECALRTACELGPELPEPLLNLALLFADVGRREEATSLLERCVVLQPDLAEAHTGLAHLLLQQGEFEAGWREYAWRFKCADAERHRDFAIPTWDGGPIPESTLLIRAEQGLGDQLMFASCVPDAIARARLCLIECEPRLVRLFGRSFPKAKVFAHYPKRDPQWLEQGYRPEYQIHLGSLAALFRRKASDFEPARSYILAVPDQIDSWRRQLARLGAGLKVGISWRGGAPRTRRASRSVPLNQWLPILQQHATFISLQYGDCRKELEMLEKTQGVKLYHWQDAIDDYDQTAAMVAALDLVISVQTAVVHLAGAVGTSAWVLVPSQPEWRYVAKNSNMLWYPSVTLLQQSQRGDWQPVLEQAALGLRVQIKKAAI